MSRLRDRDWRDSAMPLYDPVDAPGSEQERVFRDGWVAALADCMSIDDNPHERGSELYGWWFWGLSEGHADWSRNPVRAAFARTLAGREPERAEYECRDCEKPTTSNTRRCRKCQAAYRRKLRSRKARGEVVRRFCACGCRVSSRNKDGRCMFCRSVERRELCRQERARLAQLHAEEIELAETIANGGEGDASQIKERTWREIASRRIKEVRRLLRSPDALRSRRAESKRARTSPQ